MVEKIVGHIIDCQIDSGRIKQDEIGVYQYGYTLILGIIKLVESLTPNLRV